MKILQRIKSVKFILALWYSLILIIAFTIFGFSVYLYLQHLEEKELEKNLLEEVDWISQIIDVERTRFSQEAPLDSISIDVQNRIFEHFIINPRNYAVVLTSYQGNILYQSNIGTMDIPFYRDLPAGRPVLKSMIGAENKSICVAAFREDPFIIQVAYPESATEIVLGHLLRIYAVIAPIVFIVSLIGGWLMAGVALRPISDITRRANRITAENLDERIPPRDVPDEIGTLITTINKMIERLHDSFKQTREFSVNVAHELKTPLTIMKGEAELALRNPITSEEAQQLIGSYIEEIVRMSRIVDDLLTLAKVGAGQISIQHEPVEMNQLLRDLYDDAVILSSSKDLKVTITTDQPVFVSGDEVRLRQLFRILLTNAVQYTDPGGSIEITCMCKDSKVLIGISDTGIGIAADDLEKVFHQFYRSDEARQRSKSGSGLGLAIAKWIVEAHQGHITVESSPGKGSRFTVELPLSSKVQ
jgi:heavy metal sensor kinase